MWLGNPPPEKTKRSGFISSIRGLDATSLLLPAKLCMCRMTGGRTQLRIQFVGPRRCSSSRPPFHRSLRHVPIWLQQQSRLIQCPALVQLVLLARASFLVCYTKWMPLGLASLRVSVQKEATEHNMPSPPIQAAFPGATASRHPNGRKLEV